MSRQSEREREGDTLQNLHLAAQLCKSDSLWALAAKRDHQQRWTPPDWRPRAESRDTLDTLANMLIGFVICTLDDATRRELDEH